MPSLPKPYKEIYKDEISKITDLAEAGDCLTPWEEEFVESIQKWTMQEKPLTERQIETIEKIYGRVFEHYEE